MRGARLALASERFGKRSRFGCARRINWPHTAEPALLVHHDEDAKIFINGKLVIELPGYVAEYKTLPLHDAAKAVLQVGSNVLAVHCRQTGGGQFIDVHLIDAVIHPSFRKFDATRLPSNRN